MNRKSKFDRRKGGNYGNDEVDLLLQSAEDEVLLNLSVDSHMSPGVSQASYIDPDLDRRFQSLKFSRPTSKTAKPPPEPQTPPTKTTVDGDDDDDEKAKAKEMIVDSSNISEDDLFARFSALKSSIPSSSSFDRHDSLAPDAYNSGDEQSNRRTIASDELNEDEVQNVIQWAIDAARLDPSPSTDTDDDDNADSSYDDDDDSDHYSDDHQKKGKRKKGQKGK